MFIDTHCHLDDDRYKSDIEEIIQRAKDKKVEKFIIPAADSTTLQRAVDLAEEYKNIYFAVGVHPYDIGSYDREYLEKFVSHPKCVAIGECGLDYYRLPSDPQEIEEEKRLQKKIFKEQILWAKELKKPLIVHIRDASADSLEMLEQYAGEKGGVLHCYNADESLLRLSEKNFYFGIGGVLTFKNAKKLINIYPKIPKDKLLIETDSPYLTPHPHRGERNEPSYISIIAQKMSELSSITLDEMEKLSQDNTKRLFGI
ncbi:MAG: TatD family hydrolase [Sulfurovum sp.]